MKNLKRLRDEMAEKYSDIAKFDGLNDNAPSNNADRYYRNRADGKYCGFIAGFEAATELILKRVDKIFVETIEHSKFTHEYCSLMDGAIQQWREEMGE